MYFKITNILILLLKLYFKNDLKRRIDIIKIIYVFEHIFIYNNNEFYNNIYPLQYTKYNLNS